jgi:hypothetical protein
MPRYFFDINAATCRVHDDVGLELPDRLAARHAATTALPRTGRRAGCGPRPHVRHPNVRTEDGAPVLRPTLIMTAEWLPQQGSAGPTCITQGDDPVLL